MRFPVTIYRARLLHTFTEFQLTVPLTGLSITASSYSVPHPDNQSRNVVRLEDFFTSVRFAVTLQVASLDRQPAAPRAQLQPIAQSDRNGRTPIRQHFLPANGEKVVKIMSSFAADFLFDFLIQIELLFR